MLTRRIIVQVLQGILLIQFVLAIPEDIFGDAGLGVSTPYHHDLLRRNVNYTTACLPPVKRISVPSDTCKGLHGCGAWCCRNDQECCTGSGGGCMPKGADNCGGRGYCDNGLLCCGLSTGTCYPPKAGKCCGSPRGIWCPFGSDCKCPITGCYCSAHTTTTKSTATSDVTVAISKSTSAPTTTAHSTSSSSSHISLTISSSSTSQPRSATSMTSTSATVVLSGRSANQGSMSAGLDLMKSSQLPFIVFVAHLAFVLG